MKILLIDVDSKIPNIALMKLSTYHKNKGDLVDFIRLNGKEFIYKDTHDLAYASIIFTKNKYIIYGNVIYGGTGFSLKKELPEEVEHLMPDYSLYPENEYSIGFLTRGCCRKCSFCVVPKKEGTIRFYAHVDEFYNSKLKYIRILDNNLFSYSGWKDCLLELKNLNVRIKFENFDVRLLTEEKAELLSTIKVDGNYIFALDHPNEIPIFEQKVSILKKYFHPWMLKFYILVGYNTTIKEDINRIYLCIKNKFLPYIMRHENCYISPYKDFYTDLSAWCNQPQFIKKMSFEEFLFRRHISKNAKNRIDFSLSLWMENQ
jgi:hypothetical protein